MGPPKGDHSAQAVLFFLLLRCWALIFFVTSLEFWDGGVFFFGGSTSCLTMRDAMPCFRQAEPPLPALLRAKLCLPILQVGGRSNARCAEFKVGR
jgi:hypothetical protein